MERDWWVSASGAGYVVAVVEARDQQGVNDVGDAVSTRVWLVCGQSRIGVLDTEGEGAAPRQHISRRHEEWQECCWLVACVRIEPCGEVSCGVVICTRCSLGLGIDSFCPTRPTAHARTHPTRLTYLSCVSVSFRLASESFSNNQRLIRVLRQSIHT